MGKVIDKGWWPESDPRYQEGWTMSVSLGIKPQSGKPAEKKELPLMSHEDLVRSIQHNHPNLTREEIEEQIRLFW
mgnify:CR=1 FL=1